MLNVFRTPVFSPFSFPKCAHSARTHHLHLVSLLKGMTIGVISRIFSLAEKHKQGTNKGILSLSSTRETDLYTRYFNVIFLLIVNIEPNNHSIHIFQCLMSSLVLYLLSWRPSAKSQSHPSIHEPKCRGTNITLFSHMAPTAESAAVNEKTWPINRNRYQRQRTVLQLHFQYIKILISFICIFGFSQLVFITMTFRFGISWQLMMYEDQAWWFFTPAIQ